MSPTKIPFIFFSRIDHRNTNWRGCECQRCTPTPDVLYIAMGGDGLDSEGYPLGSPREWSDDELRELRRHERACDDHGNF
jgi:hypothetical protein